MFEMIIAISEHLHLAELDQGSPNAYKTYTIFAELQRSLPKIYVLAFDSLCGALVKVTKHLLAYYRRLQTFTIDSCSRFQVFTRLLLSLQSSNGGCQTCSTLRQSLWSSNGG